LALVDVYSSPRYRDLEKAVSNLKTFTGLCPSSLQGYIGTAQTGDPDMIREAARTLRRLLPPRRDAEALEAYATLWSLEFKSRPASEYDLLRKQIALDLKRIRALGLKETRQWYGALREGYELVDDRNGSDWARREGDRRFPRAWDLSAQEAWSRDHPPPAPHDPPEARQAYHHARLKETEKRVKERPDSTFLWSIRLEAIEHLDDVPVPEIETAVDGMLKAIEASSGDWGPGYPNLFDVARTLSEKDLQPERVVELARKGLEQIEIESHEWEDDLSVKEISDTTEFFTSSDFVQGLQLEIGGYLRLRQGDKARAELAQLDQRLQALKSLAGDRDELRKTYAAQEAAYKGLIARLEESENHKLDAMAYYEEALLSRLEAGALPATGEKDDLAVEARRLWDEMGGTQEGWDGWYGRRARALAEASRLTWSTSEQPLPLFKLVDLAGKTWRLEDLKGKVTLLNFWASW